MLRKRIQLGLIHVAVAITLVPINSTLNRVMIKELALSAALVAALASLPYLFSPAQVLIGAFSDRHPLFGRRRSPYIALGLLLCAAGVAFSPQVAYLMAGQPLPGALLGILAFGAWGMGFNLASVAYLSLASELSGEEGRSRTVSVMWFMMIVGIIITSLTLSRLLATYSPATLQGAFMTVAMAALLLGVIGLWGLEPRTPPGRPSPQSPRISWKELFRVLAANQQARRFFLYLVILLAAILGQDILLEPFAGQAFGLAVEETTRITSIWGTCFLAALLVAGWLERRLTKRRVAQFGAWGAAAGLAIIAMSGLAVQQEAFSAGVGMFGAGVVLLGLATGLATVSNLSLMLDMTTQQVGLFIGAWGMAEAIARLLGSLLSGGLRDVITSIAGNPLDGYIVVFLVEAAFLLVSLWMLRRVDVNLFRQQARQLDLSDTAALLNESM